MTELTNITPPPKKNKGGRPKGSLDPHTKLKNKTEKELQKRIFAAADKLFRSQAVVALGTWIMLKKSLNAEGNIEFQKVNDIQEIEKELATGVHGLDYVIVAGSKPDAKAANMLLDRGYGKARENISVTDMTPFSLKALAERRALLDAEQDRQLLDDEQKKNAIEVSAVIVQKTISSDEDIMIQ